MKPIALLTVLVLPLDAAVERYKTEPAFLARLAELGHTALQEDFEGSAWNSTRSTISTPSSVPSVTAKRITWDSVAAGYYPYHCNPVFVRTNTNWGRAGHGVFDSCIATTMRISAPEPIFGIGFWVNTNPDGQDVGILFPGRATANEPGYVLNGYGAMYPGDIHPTGHAFLGFVDPDGFTGVVITGTLEVNEENQLEGATTWGADDFTFGVADHFIGDPLDTWRELHFTAADLAEPSAEHTIWGITADPDGDGLSNDTEFALGTDPNNPSDANGGIIAEVMPQGEHVLISLTFRRRNDDPALTTLPELSGNLVAWSTGPAFFETLSAVDQGNGYDLVTVRTLTPTAFDTAAFARLAITRTTP